MLELGVDLGAVLILPIVCLAVVIWAIMTAAPRSGGGVRAPTGPESVAERRDWIAAEAERGIRQFETYLAHETFGRRSTG